MPDEDWYGAITGDSPPRTGGMVPVTAAQDDEPRAALWDEIARVLRWSCLSCCDDCRDDPDGVIWSDSAQQADALLPLLAAREAAAHAAGRAEGLRDAEQAVRDAWVYGHPVLVRAYRDGAVAAVRALSSGTPTTEERP